MVIQSTLFFVLGLAASAFLLTLCSPLIWRRMLFLARNKVKTTKALSSEEQNLHERFLRAQHAVELEQERQKAQAFERIIDSQKIKLDAHAEQLAKLAKLEERSSQMAYQIAQYRHLIKRERELIAHLHKEQRKTKEEVHSCLMSEKSIRINLAAYEEKMQQMERHMAQLAEQREQDQGNKGAQHPDGQAERHIEQLRSELKAFACDLIKEVTSKKEISNARSTQPPAQTEHNIQKSNNRETKSQAARHPFPKQLTIAN